MDFSHSSTALLGICLLIVELPKYTHLDTPYSVWLPWANDRPVAENSAPKHT